MTETTRSYLIDTLERLMPPPPGLKVKRVEFRAHEQGRLAALQYENLTGHYIAATHRVIRETLVQMDEEWRGGITYRLGTSRYRVPLSPGAFFAEAVDGILLKPLSIGPRATWSHLDHCIWPEAEQIVGAIAGGDEASLAAELLRCHVTRV